MYIRTSRAVRGCGIVISGKYRCVSCGGQTDSCASFRLAGGVSPVESLSDELR